jgi:crotonobetainyl-CoA:carnitine CoA-transferase CaiB-like acyl-CoA transferase
MPQALHDLKIIDLTQHLAGPFCTMLLADMGATVYKIEPSWGDASRTSPQYPKVGDQSSYFMHVNRNKKSIVLDLKSPKGVEAFKRLVKESDVVVENFRPGVMDRLGIGYETLHEVNPGIIYASISGYGQTGPYVARPSFDIIAQAMSGWMWLNSREKRGLNSEASFTLSCLAGSPGDTVPGLFCALSILAALRYRDASGVGQMIDIAQTDALMTLSGLGLVRTLYSDTDADTRARSDPARIHGVYEASDGYITIRLVGDKATEAVAEAINIKPSEVTPDSEYLKNWFKERTRAQITEVLSDKVPCAPVLTDIELIDDPNVKARGMIQDIQHPDGFTYHAVSTGIKFSETPVSIRIMPPGLGVDSVEVLKGLGYSDAEVKQLVDEKVTVA